MKKKINFTLVLIVLIPVAFSCRKDDLTNEADSTVGGFIVSLNSKLLYSSYYDGSVDGNLSYSLDLDNDNVSDITIVQYNSVGGYSGELSYTKLVLGNDYEVLTKTDSIPAWYKEAPSYQDTVYYWAKKSMPLGVDSGVEINSMDNSFTNSDSYISYSDEPGSESVIRSDEIFDQLISEEIVTFVLKKTVNNLVSLGWLRLKVLDYTKIKLVSYHKMINSNSIIIN